jgi:DNA-binding MarR family transcriptional regulator
MMMPSGSSRRRTHLRAPTTRVGPYGRSGRLVAPVPGQIGHPSPEGVDPLELVVGNGPATAPMGHDVAMSERGSAPADRQQVDSREDLVDALLSASRVMVSLAARSVAEIDSDVTLPQYRAMVVLASRGPQRVVDISTELGVNSSTGTRMCERLVRKDLVRRERSDIDRREVRLTLTPAGEFLVQEVTRRRREELARIVDTVPELWQQPVSTALRSLAVTAGEVPDSEWWLGWHDGDTRN